MSHAHPERPASSESGAAQAPTPEQAQALLAQAAEAARTLPAPVPAALIGYGVLCTVGSFATLATHLAPHMTAPPAALPPFLTILLFSFAWILAAVLAMLVFRERWRRGLGRRWLMYMAVWAALWVLGMFLGATALGLVLAPAFIVVFMIAVTTEAKKARQSGGAG
ncbi:hypothetical protein [Brevibacterium album]|uniref:hypothetical protein n=1 Tax=Brevibacterium album TaxID=417948 RepID=UPI000425FE6F|nr:hypothetical protein [Brevibacterium album]